MATVFKSKPNIKPIKAPKAGFVATANSFPLINSPKKAPKNGPKIIPAGPIKKIPIMMPKPAPIMPNLLALYFFAPIMGAIKSKIDNSAIKIKNITILSNDIF